MNAKDCIQRYDSLKTERSNWESLWQECADFALPRKAHITKAQVDGEKKGQDIYNGTAEHSNELLAGALHGWLTNPSTLFFEITTGNPEMDDEDEIREFLQKETLAMHSDLNQSNFQTEIAEDYIDGGIIGTSCLWMDEDDEEVIRFSTRHISEYVVDENSKGYVDTILRKFQWDARKIVQEYGLKNVGKDVADAFKNHRPEKFDILHAVYPRSDEEKKGKVGKESFAFASKHILVCKEHELKVDGYHEFPAAVSRWIKTSGEKYGRSPTMKALANIKMVNSMMKTTLKGAQKAVDPPLMVADDGMFGGGKIKTAPASINYGRMGNGDFIKPFGHDSRVDFGIELVKLVDNLIREAYYVDQLQLRDGPQMTATEVQARSEQMLRFMGPVLGRQQNEKLKAIVNRLFGIRLRTGRIKEEEIPESLSGKNLMVKYSSQIAKAQRQSEAQSITRVFEIGAPFIQANAEVLDNLDGDEALRYIASLQKLPAKILRKKRAVKQMRDERAKAQMAQMQQEQAMQTAEMAGTAAPALKAMSDAEMV